MKFINQTVHVHHTTTTVLRPFFRDHLGKPVPEENFWTIWCKGRLTEADTQTIRLGATPAGLTSAHLHHPLIFKRPDALHVQYHINACSINKYTPVVWGDISQTEWSYKATCSRVIQCKMMNLKHNQFLANNKANVSAEVIKHSMHITGSITEIIIYTGY